MAIKTKRQNIRCAQGKEYVEALTIQTPVASSNSSPASSLHTQPSINTTVFLRLPKVIGITGLGKSTIYQKMDDGTFPRSFRISGRAVAWLAYEIDTWMKERVAERGNAPSHLSQDDVQSVPVTHSSELSFFLLGNRQKENE